MMDAIELGEEMTMYMTYEYGQDSSRFLFRVRAEAKRKFCARKVFERKIQRQVLVLTVILAILFNNFSR
jgi:hypothetical protein